MIELELEEAKEIIGASPMSQDLMNRVNNTTQRLPVLKDLRTEALKERHWKQISEVVGADLTSSGKKITLEVLDKYNVFNFGGGNYFYFPNSGACTFSFFYPKICQPT